MGGNCSTDSKSQKKKQKNASLDDIQNFTSLLTNKKLLTNLAAGRLKEFLNMQNIPIPEHWYKKLNDSPIGPSIDLIDPLVSIKFIKPNKLTIWYSGAQFDYDESKDAFCETNAFYQQASNKRTSKLNQSVSLQNNIPKENTSEQYKKNKYFSFQTNNPNNNLQQQRTSAYTPDKINTNNTVITDGNKTNKKNSDESLVEIQNISDQSQNQKNFKSQLESRGTNGSNLNVGFEIKPDKEISIQEIQSFRFQPSKTYFK